MADTLEQTIRENADGPKRAGGDTGSIEQHSIKDQIEADRYLASKQAARKGMRCLRRTRVCPPGAV